MKSIHSQSDFDTALKAENAVIFIHFSQSQTSVSSLPVVEQWEHELATLPACPAFEIYLLEPDGHPFTWKWANMNAAFAESSSTCGGTILWLRRGVVVGGLQNAAQAGVKALVHMNDECFVRGKSPGLSTPPSEILPFDLELLEILCCPETHQKLQLATPPVLEKLNQQLSTRRLYNRAGRLLDETVTAGLVRADGKYLYPMRQNIPILLLDEAIPLTN